MTPNIDYILFLADSHLILSQRNAEWCGHGPILEQDIALTNITLDLLGQARMLYAHAAEMMNRAENTLAHTEDSLAYLRSERQFRNLLITELPKGDWGFTVLRQFLFSSFMQLVYEGHAAGSDNAIKPIAEKALKETAYHIKWSGEWAIRLGDGTPESHGRIQTSLNGLWPYTGEFFMPGPFENNGYDSTEAAWQKKTDEVLQRATLKIPENVFMYSGGKEGVHTEYLGYILAEMQFLQRAYPGATW